MYIRLINISSFYIKPLLYCSCVVVCVLLMGSIYNVFGSIYHLRINILNFKYIRVPKKKKRRRKWWGRAYPFFYPSEIRYRTNVWCVCMWYFHDIIFNKLMMCIRKLIWVLFRLFSFYSFFLKIISFHTSTPVVFAHTIPKPNPCSYYVYVLCNPRLNICRYM